MPNSLQSPFKINEGLKIMSPSSISQTQIHEQSNDVDWQDDTLSTQKQFV